MKNRLIHTRQLNNEGPSVVQSDYLAHDAIGLAELVRTRQASARELIDIAISRTEAVNPAINAIVLKDYDAARQRASRDDASSEQMARTERIARSAQAALAGVPYLIKDLGAAGRGVAHGDGQPSLSALRSRRRMRRSSRWRKRPA